jgi:hypothetical protein
MAINWRALSITITLLAVSSMSACAPSVTVTPLGAERTYPATSDTARIPLYSVARPECPYDEIALIRAEGASKPSAAVILGALRSKARALGAHAIIGYTQRTYEWATGTAIRFRSPDCMK